MEAKTGAKADREMMWTRRISKLKIAMKEEMGAEMDRCDAYISPKIRTTLKVVVTSSI